MKGVEMARVELKNNETLLIEETVTFDEGGKAIEVERGPKTGYFFIAPIHPNRSHLQKLTHVN